MSFMDSPTEWTQLGKEKEIILTNRKFLNWNAKGNKMKNNGGEHSRTMCNKQKYTMCIMGIYKGKKEERRRKICQALMANNFSKLMTSTKFHIIV